jgi:hypothetical protein
LWRAVGSSTVYPFATAIAEAAAKSGGKSPVIESTGTGAGMKLFCAGVGGAHPDMQNASRRMKASEYADCAKNGVKDIVEIQIGLDGIAFGEAKGGPGMTLTLRSMSTRRSPPIPSASPIRRRTGATSIPPCPPFRSWSMARPRRRERAMPWPN